MKPVFFLFAFFILTVNNNLYGSPAGHEPEEEQKVKIDVLDGAVNLTMRPGVDFPCIGIQFSDRIVNMRMGTYVEIKRRDGYFLTKVQYEIEQFDTIEEALEASLRELLKVSYGRDSNEDHTEKVWTAFVEEGGMQEFIDTAKEWIDDEFLDSPWNVIYG